jgi:hypothetical protein
MEQSMSEESQSNNPLQGRSLRPLERQLIERMLRGQDVKPEVTAKLPSVLVEDMQDGGMGSIRFLIPGYSARHFGKAVAQAEYIDEDGVLVSIVINADQENELYEVDFWKVDFSPLKRYPKASDIKIKALQ